jgi:hypothetical protein
MNGLLTNHRARRLTTAFTLMEVMIASGIFFMAMFAILALVSSTLRNARGLQHGEVDAGMVAAMLSKTNRVTEGGDSGDFGDSYPDFSWETESFEADTNGLWQVDIKVLRRGSQQPVDTMSIWVYSPDSKSSAFGAATIRR